MLFSDEDDNIVEVTNVSKKKKKEKKRDKERKKGNADFIYLPNNDTY